MQVIAYLLGLAAVVLATRKTPATDRATAGILAFFWLWMGIAYHWLHFSTINKAATLFGGLFVLQGILLAWLGARRHEVAFAFRADAASGLGGLLIVYAMLVYLLIGSALGHGYPHSPVFGVAPCPTTLFTFGLFLWAERRMPVCLLVVPFLWSLLGFSAAASLGIREDLELAVAGVAAPAAILAHRGKAAAK